MSADPRSSADLRPDAFSGLLPIQDMRVNRLRRPQVQPMPHSCDYPHVLIVVATKVKAEDVVKVYLIDYRFENGKFILKRLTEKPAQGESKGA